MQHRAKGPNNKGHVSCFRRDRERERERVRGERQQGFIVLQRVMLLLAIIKSTQNTSSKLNCSGNSGCPIYTDNFLRLSEIISAWRSCVVWFISLSVHILFYIILTSVYIKMIKECVLCVMCMRVRPLFL